jgi:rRNA-processing protein FCF1
MQSVEEMIQQYDSFDVNSRRSQLLEIRQQLASQLEESVEIAKRETIANQVLTPFLDGLRDLDSQRQNTASRLHRAIDYFNRLSSAQNARQQAMVHQECEAEFGDGRVGIVKAQLQRELEAVDRKSKKLAQRAIEVARIATQRIDKLVIDGNNLCYKGDQFIGLAALKPLVHALKHEHAIVVVFDPSIRRRLGVRHAEIEKHFDSCVDVLVVATGRKADETVLDLAEISPHTYVLSNDRFSEFIDKAAVREDRVIRCEIVDGQAFVHALKVGVCY